MKRDSITLTGKIHYNESYPPKDAKKGYVAKILGTASGSMKYQREFLGSEVQIVSSESGLFERQNGEKKGGFIRWYPCILSHPEHGLIIDADVDEVEVKKIAKLLDAGIDIDNAVEVTELKPIEDKPEYMQFTAKARTASQATKVAKSATIESAIESCWSILSLMPDDSKKKVMSQLKKRLASNDSSE